MKDDSYREVIEKIRTSVPIVDIIGNYVQLKKTGKAYRGLCPFHAEKTPSFYVDPDKGLYHCFGCGASGNVFTFLMKKEGLTFAEAVRELAQIAGIKIETEARVSKEFLLMKEAQSFFQNALYATTEGKAALNYLNSRKISQEAILSFGLGYAPGSGLVNYLKNKGFDFYTMLKVGILKENQHGGYSEFFRHRLIFPILDHFGNVVAFGGRALDSSDEPKYINTPETDFFKKGKILYGFYINRKEIKERGFPVIVEGYFDVIALFMMGMKNGVAPMGTALTSDQATFISTQISKVKLFFDNDDAGMKATLRSIKVLLERGVLPYVVRIENAKDPAEMWENGEADGVSKAIESAVDFARYVMSISGSIEERASNVRELLESIQKAENPVLRKDFSDLVAEAFGIESIGFKEVLKLLGGQKKVEDVTGADFALAVAALLDERIREALLTELDAEDFTSEDARSIYLTMKEGKTPEEIVSDHPQSERIVEYAMSYIGEINDVVRDEILKKIKAVKASKARKVMIKQKIENKESVEKILVEFFKSKRENLRG
ncbi:MAG TPA: DNA primase [Candidatus Hydrothermia bacterium]|nr:DNA primase [Candidatus Hydrothermia bacterium]MDD5572370.1 DNA primase [Candidatus Hydrothermia bacterium]HOK23313.1 DNA primase [Candidatus Hydrothermia bacterium]HOL24122.1 DNA primase [Candidatus Hydrothermia bacterium]HPO79022.1 DNA primase [Candidatus Hydrothermia bacterium]